MIMFFEGAMVGSVLVVIYFKFKSFYKDKNLKKQREALISEFQGLHDSCVVRIDENTIDIRIGGNE